MSTSFCKTVIVLGALLAPVAAISASPAAPAILSGFCAGADAGNTAGTIPGLGVTPSADVTECFNNYTVDQPIVLGLILPSGGALKNLTVQAAPNGTLGGPLPPGTQVQFAVWVNGIQSSLTCTLVFSTPVTTCTDTVNTVPVRALDRVVVQLTTAAWESGFLAYNMGVSLEKMY
jgi:hypothetical protein